ncbi:MLO-like protein 13 [Populus alba]|nr:MLO-like protein 13 isoform X2 [Populus alba]
MLFQCDFQLLLPDTQKSHSQGTMAEESKSLQYTPSWVIAAVCFVIVLASIFAERGLHKLGKFLRNTKQDALFEALQKLKEELMLLGFISLLLTVTQNTISRMCIPPHLAITMLPCKRETASSSHEKIYNQAINNRRHLLSATNSAERCAREGKVPLVSVEALHQLHIFIFVLAIVHVIFCVSTMILGGARIRQWKTWEESIRHESKTVRDPQKHQHEHHFFHKFIKRHEKGYWRKSAVLSWLIAFFKQFYGSITKSDYIALRKGFIAEHCPRVLNFDFHDYMMRTLQIDFKRIVTISWYLWLFIVMFLLMNVEGWHSFFWLSFLPVILLLLVGAKLEHIITSLGHRVAEMPVPVEQARVKPSDEHFWLEKPAIVLDLIQFILFQNSFEIAFFFWIWSTYGFRSCIMEKVGYIVPRLIMGLAVQVLCSYSTLPLYALVSQMGTRFRKGMFGEDTEAAIENWAGGARDKRDQSENHGAHMDKLATESSHSAAQEMVIIGGTELSSVTHAPVS